MNNPVGQGLDCHEFVVGIVFGTLRSGNCGYNYARIILILPHFVLPSVPMDSRINCDREEIA